MRFVAEDVPSALRLLEGIACERVHITIGRGKLWRYLDRKFAPAHRALLARIRAFDRAAP